MKSTTLPFYAKLAYILVSLIALGYLCILGQSLLAPLFFSLLFAILLLPVAGFLERRFRLPRGAAAGIAIVLLIALVVGVLWLLGTQVSVLADSWPQLKKQVLQSFSDIQEWVTRTFHVNAKRQINYIHNATDSLLSSSTSIISAAFLSITSSIFLFLFAFLYAFFILLHRSLFFRFLIAAFKQENEPIVRDIVLQIQSIIKKYISGLFLEMSIVATVACLALWAVGSKYALLLGLIVGIFNIVPYIGIFSALLFSLLITFATSDPAHVLFVGITVVSIHLLDSNILMPQIVGSKVRINALILIIGVVIGESLWGIGGMFLSVPFIAMLKIIFDRVESLQPWGILLGDETKKSKPIKVK